jgi:uncharacterized protein
MAKVLVHVHSGPEAVSKVTLGDHFAGLAAGGATILVSGMSALARGYDEGLLAPFGATFAMPDRLVALAVEVDSTLCY